MRSATTRGFAWQHSPGPASLRRASQIGFVRATCVYVGLLSGCTARDRTPVQPVSSLSVQRGESGQSEATFLFSGDITILATGPERSALLGSVATAPAENASDDAPRTVAQYHLEYLEYGERVVLTITPPSQYATKPEPGSGGRRLAPWSSISRIRTSSDSSASALTLWDGRTIASDFATFGSLGASARLRSRTGADVSPAQRAAQLRGKIRPMLRTRPGSAFAGAGFDSTGAGASIDRRTTWVPLSSEFDVATSRMLVQPSARTGKHLSLTIEVANARTAGIPQQPRKE